jgi:hypothetical protein
MPPKNIKPTEGVLSLLLLEPRIWHVLHNNKQVGAAVNKWLSPKSSREDIRDNIIELQHELIDLDLERYATL